MESSAISKAAGDSSGMSSAEVSRLEMQLRNAKSDLAELQGELDRAKAASSGSEKDKAAVQQQLQDDLTKAKFAVPSIYLRDLILVYTGNRAVNFKTSSPSCRISSQRSKRHIAALMPQ